MIDQLAIQALQNSVGIDQASNVMGVAMTTNNGIVALPSDFKQHDLEQYMGTRRRMRGLFKTSVIADFATYVKTHKEEGACVFVSADQLSDMSAWAILNMGTTANPGHTDNRAKLALRMTAAFAALRNHTTNGCISQVKAAEFLEDWSDFIQCFKDTEQVQVSKAVAAVRRLSIDSYRKLESSEQSLSSSKSAFESVQATSIEPLPTHIYFNCIPFHELSKRTFVLRFGVQTGGDKPSISLRIVNEEVHVEDMSQEFAGLVRDALTDVPVGVGFYESK
jgi:uncharacterized protein YfdQ (DUF2303 family)